MKLHFNAGVDIGNSELDAYIDGKLIRQPNVFAVSGKNPWSDDDLDVKKNLSNMLPETSSFRLSRERFVPGQYVVGRHALEDFWRERYKPTRKREQFKSSKRFLT